MLDPAFKMEDDCTFSSSRLSVKIAKESFDRVYWESILNDLRSSIPVYDRILDVIININENIGCEIRDDDVIDRMERGELEAEYVTNLVSRLLNAIKSNQLPERIAGTNASWENLQHIRRTEPLSVWFVNALRFLLNRATTIRIDAFNKR
jgi:hypothetical protein